MNLSMRSDLYLTSLLITAILLFLMCYGSLEVLSTSWVRHFLTLEFFSYYTVTYQMWTTMIKRFSLSACLALKGISHDIWYDYGIGYYQTQTWILCKHKNYSTIGLSLNTSSLGIIKDYRCSIRANSNAYLQPINWGWNPQWATA